MLIGVVGKPSVGKSTFFKAATLAEVEIANYPFTTIKPNHGVGYVKVECVEKFFNTKCNPRLGFCIDGNRFVPVDLLDVAGLVAGAYEGKGMGNQFLNDLLPADVLIHVVDISGSTNEKGEAVEAGSYDPLKDIKFLEFELDMWYYQSMKKGWEKFARTVQQEKTPIFRALAKQLSSLKVTEDMVKEEIRKLNLKQDPTTWDQKDLINLASILRRITKPIILACNKADVPISENNFERLKKEFPEYKAILCSGDYEVALREAARANLIEYIPGESSFEIIGDVNEKQKAALELIQKFLDKFKATGVQQVLDSAVFEVLKYLAIFPGGTGKLEDSEGRRLPDCFLLPPKSTALDFAFKLHTDLGKGFIRAIDIKTKKIIG
ncbi:MAG: redox-regulated ATPase YchF, partial [Candidatus Nanoarchaeia archaeon]|nr:redox-regulated ATPase YchF [Candidatus Nanoarchaeia archaeon]